MADRNDLKIAVQVFGSDMPVGGCGCGCGSGWGCGPDDANDAPTPTIREQAEDLGRRLARYYGSGVSVEYVDVYSTRMEEFPAVLRVVGRGSVPLPIIGFDGKAKFAGGISIEMISETLEKMGLVPLEEPSVG